MKRFNAAAAFALFGLICLCGGLFARLVWLYTDGIRREFALYAVAALMSVYLIFEIRSFVHYARTRVPRRPAADGGEASALVLLNEDGGGVRAWDIRGKTGVVIGRSRGDEYADVDLSDTEFASVISSCHAALNYTAEGWRLADCGSQNGTAVIRNGTKLTLEPNEPVPVRSGDRICLAEETVLAME